jgi:hypothetical protein
VDRDRQFDHAKAGTKVAAGLPTAEIISAAQFIGQLAELAGGQLAQIGGNIDSIEQGSCRIWSS